MYECKMCAMRRNLLNKTRKRDVILTFGVERKMKSIGKKSNETRERRRCFSADAGRRSATLTGVESKSVSIRLLVLRHSLAVIDRLAT